jgi:hypothetical protein
MPNEITIQAAQEKVDNWIKTVGVKYFSELTNFGYSNGRSGRVVQNIGA